MLISGARELLILFYPTDSSRLRVIIIGNKWLNLGRASSMCHSPILIELGRPVVPIELCLNPWFLSRRMAPANASAIFLGTFGIYCHRVEIFFPPEKFCALCVDHTKIFVYISAPFGEIMPKTVLLQGLVILVVIPLASLPLIVGATLWLGGWVWWIMLGLLLLSHILAVMVFGYSVALPLFGMPINLLVSAHPSHPVAHYKIF